MINSLNSFLRIVYLGSQLAINLFLFIIIINYFSGTVSVILTSSFWLAYSFADIYNSEQRLQRIEGFLGDEE